MKPGYIGLAIAGILLSGAAAAWFGETAAQQENVELEFRGIFILVVYSLLYGTFLGEPTGTGLLEIFKDIEALVLMTPPLTYPLVHNIIRYFIVILQPFYILAILGCGLYLMFFSGSPSGRLRAKRMLPVLIASMVFASISIQILQLLFNLSSQLAAEIMGISQSPIDTLLLETINELVALFTASTIVTFDGGFMFLLMIFALTVGLFTVLALRYVALMFFSMVFPVGIFFYSFSPSRRIGRLIIEQTILWSLAQVAIAMILAISTLAARFFAVTGDLKTLLGVAAFAAVIISPLMLIALIRRFLP